MSKAEIFDDIIFQLFDKLSVGIIIYSKEAEIVYMNDSAAKINSVEKKKCIDKNISTIFPRFKTRCIVFDVIESKKVTLKQAEQYRNYRGCEISFISSAYPLYKGKRLIGVLQIFHNEDKEAQKDNKKLTEEFDWHDERSSSDGVYDDKSENTNQNKYKKYDFIDIIGKNIKILNAKEKASKASLTSSPVLIYGETGAGKELFVQAIHYNSYRKNKPFIAQNCAAIPPNLLEGILFGTVKGSFTGAENREGLFELANGGSLYLDELNSMPLELQPKLLRVLQEGTIRRVGDTNQRNVDVRVIASVNELPEKILDEGSIRKDLYYRLNVVRINIPPLRERKEDIPLLVKHFIEKFNKKFNANITSFDSKVFEKLYMHNWQGNVRELEHFIESVFNFKKNGIIYLEDINQITSLESPEMITLNEKLKDTEKKYIKEAMLIANGNISKASKILGIPRQTLQYKLKKLK